MADGAPAADEVLVLVRGEQVKGKFITPCECFVLPSWLLKSASLPRPLLFSCCLSFPVSSLSVPRLEIAKSLRRVNAWRQR